MWRISPHHILRATFMLKNFLNNFVIFKFERRTFSAWLNEFHSMLIDKGMSKKTIANKGSLMRVLNSKLGKKNISKITTLELAAIIKEYVNRDTRSAAKSMYHLMCEIFREAYFNGWVKTDPTVPLRCPKAPTKRSRITLDELKKILDCAKKSDQQYIYQASILALVTGQRRSDIAKIKRSHIKSGFLFIRQAKTGEKIAIPIKLHCDGLGMTLEYVIKNICTGRKYLIENQGQPVKLYLLSKYFSFIRDKVFFDTNYWAGTPATFHEIRSLSERLYRDQGIDTRNLLGHKSQKMTDKYNDSRGREWRYLRI